MCYTFDAIITGRWMQMCKTEVQNSEENTQFLIIITENGRQESYEMVMTCLGSSQYCLVCLMVP
jgi:hypothetical protein